MPGWPEFVAGVVPGVPDPVPGFEAGTFAKSLNPYPVGWGVPVALNPGAFSPVNPGLKPVNPGLFQPA